METITNIFAAVCFYWVLALAIIGPFQVIAAIFRAIFVKEWKSKFGKQLKIYFLLLLGYWILAAIALVINKYIVSISWIIYVFVPILCTLLALYYWRIIYLLYKEQKEIEHN